MKKAMVLGAGKSGISAKKILEKNGYKVTMVDDKIGITSREGLKYLDEIDIFIKSPGVPYIELVLEAKRKKIEIIDEIELSYRELKNTSPKTKIIAITGTNGKTTTVSKIAELIECGGYKVGLCGNIGVPFGDIVLDNASYDYIVIELSSFQLENLKEFRADIAGIINLTPDHLDRYTSIVEYYDTKLRVGINQKETDKFIINLEDVETSKRLEKISGGILGVTRKINKEGYLFIEKNCIIYNDEIIIKTDDLSLRGDHNLQNVLFIIAVGKIINISNEIIRDYLRNAKSIEHRLELFLEVGKVKFINDSKGTNIESTKFAIGAYPNSILICGGKNKGLELYPLAEEIIAKGIKQVLLIGENRYLIKSELESQGYPSENIKDLETILGCGNYLKSNLNLEEENAVVFSPGTSSYDQFENFEDRGRKFKEVINSHFKK